MTTATQRSTRSDNWSADTGSAKDYALDGVRARRNLLIGHWAGGLMGLRDEALSEYIAALHLSDHAVAGDSDIVAKLKHDFAAKSISIDDRELNTMLRNFHGQALRETSCTE